MSSDPTLLRTAFILPELLYSVGNYLDPPDLLSCVQVCWLWNQHLIPQLWRTVDDRFYSWPSVLHRVTQSAEAQSDADNVPWLLDVFRKHGRHIRHLSAEWVFTIAIAVTAGSVTDLESLAIYESFQHRKRYSQPAFLSLSDVSDEHQELLTPAAQGRALSSRSFVQKFWNLVAQNHSLDSIELAGSCQLEHFSTILPSHLNTLAALPHLTKLVNNMAAFDLQSLLEHLPALRYYACPINWIQDNSTVNNVALRTVFPLLRTLLFHVRQESGYNERPPLQHATILTLVRCLPNLERLSLSGNRWFIISDYPLPSVAGVTGIDMVHLDNAPTGTSSIRDFHFTYAHRYSTHHMKDVLANHILPRMPLLAKLSLQILSRSAAEALAKHCPQLESLTLTSTKYDTIDPDAITPLLHHCSRLKHLDAIWHAVEAASLVTSPVVCRGLEVFRCQITGIGEEEEEYEVDSEDEDWENTGQEENDKDDDDNEEINTAESKQERCQKHHHHIYDELGRLTELRVLELGVDNVDGYDIMGGFPGNYLVDGRLYYQHFGPTLNTLELSLQSGLDRLKTLKKLQVFGFEGVDHRIGIDELTWMAENWPQLQVMHGIQAPDEKDEYSLSCPKVKELREHMQRLRPLVKHEVGRS